MKKYFYTNGKEQFGAFSLEELKNKDILPETLIWFEGLSDWTPASNLAEIKTILEFKQASISTQEKIKSNKQEKEKLKISDNQNSFNLDKGHSSQSIPSKKGMFSNPFSFNGRIRRTEYGLSFIIYIIGDNLVRQLSYDIPVIGLALIPLIWFLWAQGAKRCHDIGKSGWWQIIPFYVLWMFFEDGKPGSNKYGLNQKG